CGTNIAGIVDVPSVVEYAQGLPGVVYAEENLFSCAQDTQDKMGQIVKEKKLNRVVVAACTPKTHEPVFRETLLKAGINPYLFEMANIRNQCSWVHADNPSAATEKSKDLVRMAAAKVALLEPLHDPILDITQRALVVGGGMAGLAAAINLGDQGYHTYLIEKDDALGGQARHIFQTWRGEDVQEQLTEMIQKAMFHHNIEVCLNSQITAVDGFVGNFKSEVTIGEKARVFEHGVTVIATGASELQPTQYLYGKDPRVMTGLELQKRFVDNDSSLNQVETAVFVQCVGSRIPERPYCSKVCCTQSIQSALKLKEINPQMRIYVLYRSMRPYGLREDLYREARSKGIAFVRYNVEEDFSVNRDNQGLEVGFTDRVLKRKMEIRPDLLVLAAAIVPEKENPLAQFFKVPRNDDGFFAEAHVKLRPVDFATEGVFVCGLAHAPKSIDESIAQGQAAAARAVTLLSAKTIAVTGTVAQVDPSMCSECGICVSICPFSAPSFNEKTGKAEIEPTLCKGCGLCVASCRSGAIHLKGFDTSQIMAMIEQAM
ncbi:MAG: CoB--CoM heterodisulfide reductase iron-sulfur subunit A family protein, partial [Deltaproteobacteria bacterium]|nr:CoB--CoM heterodisulfide reductase iron-sulfur subunit A family protein [Deltaproteobacteria bacterium]